MLVESRHILVRMELVVAPIVELRARLTHLFEDVVGATLDGGAPAAGRSEGFACGLTGGATALIFLSALRDAAVDWSRVTLYWGDERAVPPDHPDSNFGLAERLLLTPLGARAPNARRMPADHANLAAAAREYAAELPAALDLLILGAGDDGHVCSLFPGHRALTTRDERVTAIDDSPKPPRRRMTLTLPYVLASRRTWIVVVGPHKAPVLQRAVDRQQLATPLELVAAQGADVTIFTDQPVRDSSSASRQ